MTQESTNPATSLDPPRQSKGWLVDQIESNADYQRRLNEIAVRKAAFDAQRDRIGKNISMAFFVIFMLACVYGTVMGCIAFWMAVFG